MSEIDTLFSLDLSDSMIALRLGVSRMAVNLWRRGKRSPQAPARLKARQYLSEIHGRLQTVNACKHAA